MNAGPRSGTRVPSDGGRQPAGMANLRGILLSLSLAQRAVKISLRNALAKDQLGMTDWLIMDELACGASSITALSGSLKRDAGSLSRAVNRLAERHLITNRRLASDRRRTRLALTSGGRKLHEHVARRIEQMVDTLPNPASDWKLIQLRAHLEKVCCRDVNDSNLDGK